MVSKLKNEYFLELVGYCLEDGNRMLAYQFATMGSLHNILHGVCVVPLRFNLIRALQRRQASGFWTRLHTDHFRHCLCREERSSGCRARSGPQLVAASEDSLWSGERARVPPRESPAVDCSSRYSIQQRSYIRRFQLQDC